MLFGEAQARSVATPPNHHCRKSLGQNAGMHTLDLSPWTHEHVFDVGNPAAERGTRVVMWVTAAMMVVEIIGGWWLNSMALLADGLHMSSHAIAIGSSGFTYTAARRLAKDNRFACGTWNIEVLGIRQGSVPDSHRCVDGVWIDRALQFTPAHSVPRGHCHRNGRSRGQRRLRADPQQRAPSPS